MNASPRGLFAMVWLSLTVAMCCPGRAQVAPVTLPNVQLADGGTVKAMALQADGKLIIAGRFSAVNGVPRRNIARINPNGSVDQTWAPVIEAPKNEADFGVLTMCLVGDRLFVGGTFKTVGKLPRAGLAKISTTGTGEADPLWNPNPTDGGDPFFEYKTFALASDGVSLFVGGKFRVISGVARAGLAKLALDGAGVADPGWAPAPATLNDKGITALALHGPFLYVGARNPFRGNKAPDLFRVSAGNGSVDASWAPALGVAELFIDAIAVSATDVFVGGYAYSQHPESASNQPRTVERAYLRKFSVASPGGSDSAWQPAIAGINDADPDTGTAVTALAQDGSSLFVGGVFASAGGVARKDIAKISTSGSGSVDLGWRADADLAKDDAADVEAFIVRGGQVIAGGSFRRINGEVALGVAPLDTLTGALRDGYRAQVQFPAFVSSIARQPDGKLVIGGNFFLANGLPRNGLVRLNTDGSVDAGWNPATEDAEIYDITIAGDEIFVAGTFTTMGGQARNGLAKLSAIGPDTADPNWNPNVSGVVGTVVAAGPHVYLGGSFDAVAETAIYSLARVSAGGAGALDAAWRPPISKRREVFTIAVNDTGVFAGHVEVEAGPGGPSLQKFSLATGAPDPAFRSAFRADITALALDGPSLYVGGYRTLARVRADTGARDSKFRAAPDNYVLNLRVGESKLYAGGLFSKIGGVARAGLARITTTGKVAVDRDWNPRPEHVESGRPGRFGFFGIVPAVYALRVDRDVVHVGGEFDTIGGEHRLSFASLAVAHAPVVLQTPDGIVISRDPANGAEVTHFRITRVTGGTLFLHDGITPVAEDDFITVAQAAEGLVFQPAIGPAEPPRFVVVAALNDTPGGAGTEATFVDLAALQAPPVFAFARAEYVIEEGAGSIALEVQKAGDTAGEVQVSTRDGSALAGSAYTATNVTLAFGAAETSKTVNIPIADNGVFEGDRSFRVALVNTSGAVLGEPAAATVRIIDNDAVGDLGSRTTIVLPNPAVPLPSTGEISVMLSPPQANGQWRAVGDPLWHDSGTVVSGLASGNYVVEFRAVNGFREPDKFTVAVLSAQRTNSAATYTAISAGAQAGLLAATLSPGFAADPATPEGSRAQWRRQGEVNWHNSGETVSLNSGVYVIEFKAIPQLFAPRPVEVQIVAGQTNSVAGVYLVADTPAAPKPQALTLAQATTQQPFLFNGQIKAGRGFASGCVVNTHVVLTAAHVLFDDETLSFATDVKWFFQRQRGQYEPPPQTPRGWYVRDGYAAQRESDGAANEPGISTPASQMLDVAAMFFADPPGRGGSSGYLASDAPLNEWLTTPRDKLLIGYPADGVPDADRGRMHATNAANLAFTRLYQAGQPVYATTDIAAFPGNSGGALCVQFSDGNYYPAAVYLGGTAQTLVRAIDASAVALINRAETSGNGGGNNVSGGGTLVGPGLGGATYTQGTLTCDLGPAPALQAGAGWRVGSSGIFRKRADKLALAAGRFRVEFKSVPGFITPAAREVEVVAGQNTEVDGAYVAAAAAITSARRVHASKDEAFRYTIVTTNNATVFGATGLPAGLAVNAQTGVIAGVPEELGTFQAVITAGTASAPLTILVEDPGTLTVAITGHGAVTKGFEGASTRIVGRTYMVTATPAADSLFDGWSGAIPETKPALKFRMEDGLVLRANFVPNVFLMRFGTYHGLIESLDAAEGVFELKLTKTGGFTMKLTLAGKRYSLSGKFNAIGKFSGEIQRRDLSPIMISLSLDLLASEPRLTGSITVDGNSSSLDGARAVFSRSNPAPAAGKHTLIFSPDPAQNDPGSFPAGHGFASLTVNAAGAIAATGWLGDGTPLVSRGVLRADHTWSVFAQPHARAGFFAGVLTFVDDAGPAIDEITGTLYWVKPAASSGRYPAGFTGRIPATGSRYTPPDAGTAALEITNWSLSIGTGVLATPLNATVTLDARNRFAVTSANGVKLAIAPATGLLTGSFPGDNGRVVAWRGALLQRQRAGRGAMLLPDRTGPIILDPP